MTTTPQDQNIDINEQNNDVDVVIDRSQLISEITNKNSNSERYRLMLSAILEQTNQDIEALKDELSGRLRMEVKESLNLNEAEVTSFTTPIEVKFGELISSLQKQDVEMFDKTLQEIREMIINKNTEQHIVDIFEKDSIQEKREVMKFLASNEKQEKKQVFEKLLKKFLPDSVLLKYQDIIANERTSLEEKYNLLNKIIGDNTHILPGISSLDDLIYLCNKMTRIGIEKTGSISGFLNSLLKKGESIIDSFTGSDIQDALVPLKSYQVASTSLNIPKRQLRSIGKLKVSQIRSVVEDQELMNKYSKNKPNTYSALLSLKNNLLNSGGPVDHLRSHFLNVANNDSTISLEFKSELYDFCANIENESLDTIITGYYCDEIQDGVDHLAFQEAAVVYRAIRTAKRSGLKGFQLISVPYNYITTRREVKLSSYPRYNSSQDPAKVLKQWEGIIESYVKADGTKVKTPQQLLSATPEQLNRYSLEYRSNIHNLQREVASMRAQYDHDLKIINANNLDEMKSKYKLGDQHKTVENVRKVIEQKRRGFENTIRKLDTKIKAHNLQLDAHVQTRQSGEKIKSSGNLDTDLRRGRLSNIGRFTMFAGLTLSGSAIGLAQGTMTARQAAVTAAESAAMMVPGLGSFLMLKQLWTGKTLAGQELNSNDMWLTAGFAFLSVATDIIALTTGVGIAAKASIMSAATSIKSAPMLTRIGYNAAKIFTQSGRIRSFIKASKNLENANKVAQTAKAASATSFLKFLPGTQKSVELFKNTWNPARSALKATSGLTKAAIFIPVVTSRVIKTVLKPIFEGIKSATSGVSYLATQARRGYHGVQKWIMGKSLKNFKPDDMKEVGRIIEKTIEKEAEIAQALKNIEKMRKQGKSIDEIKKAKINVNKVIKNIHELVKGKDKGVLEVLSVYERGANSPILRFLGTSERTSVVANKIESAISMSVLGGMVVLPAVGGVATSVFKRESAMSDFGEGYSETFSAVTSGASMATDSIAYAYNAVEGHEIARANIRRTMDDRAREMASISKLKKEWRRYNAKDLAHFYLNSNFRKLPNKLKYAFKKYAKSRGYNHQKLINIYNSNLS